MHVIVGATGQMGTRVARRLLQEGGPVRAFVREGSAYRRLQEAGVELAFGDLRDASSVEEACRGAKVVIATANTVGPRGRYSFHSVERIG